MVHRIGTAYFATIVRVHNTPGDGDGYGWVNGRGIGRGHGGGARRSGSRDGYGCEANLAIYSGKAFGIGLILDDNSEGVF